MNPKSDQEGRASAQPSRPAPTLGVAFFLGLGFLLAGCSAVRVRPTDPREYGERRRVDILNAGALSAATRDSLRTVGLREDGCRNEPRPCLRSLEPGQGLDDERLLSAAAELWLAEALAHDQPGNDVLSPALDPYLEAARASYAYLFYTLRTPGERALEDRQRQVRDFYNYATERVAALFVAAKRAEGATMATNPALRTGSWNVGMGFVDVRLPQGRSLRELVAASRLSFGGLRNSYRRDGFGAEFVTVATEPAAGEAQASREAGYMAASVVLRFAGGSLREVMETREATLDAYDSSRHESIRLRDLEVRLAANFTAPYALWLQRSRFGREAKHALLGRTEQLVQPRVYLMQPYDPDRVVVVLIHGLASSPEAWVDLANELMGDDEIRQRCQVWQVFYRTSAPITYSRHAIRRALDETLARFDPEHTAPASRGMVLVGHSMGGVLARLLLVADSDARLWTALIGRPPEEADRQRLALFSPYLDLEPMPEVSRAVFLASPHRGAPKASGWLGRLGARLVRLPASLLQELAQIADSLTEDQPETAARLRRGPDGIDALSDRSLFLEAASELSVAPKVTYHSIIGCENPSPSPPDCSDGLVPYTSAHLDGAASELIVRSGHGVQQTPEAILELRRILHLHLAER
jgi:pimeloyl-ACP methyl ester carboxylesterase